MNYYLISSVPVDSPLSVLEAGSLEAIPGTEDVWITSASGKRLWRAHRKDVMPISQQAATEHARDLAQKAASAQRVLLLLDEDR